METTLPANESKNKSPKASPDHEQQKQIDQLKSDVYDLKLYIEFIKEYGFLPNKQPKDLILEKAKLKCQIEEKAEEMKLSQQANAKNVSETSIAKDQASTASVNPSASSTKPQDLSYQSQADRLQALCLSALISVACTFFVNYFLRF